MKTALTPWLTQLTAATAANTFVKATLTKPTPKAEDLKSIDIRPIMVKRELKLSFTHHHKTRDIVKNYTPAEATKLLTQLLPQTFTTAHLFTLEADIHYTPNGLTRHPASHTQAPTLSHDKPKQRPLSATNKPYLHALGLTDAQGNVLKSSQDKFRQINKYIEILDGLLKQLPNHETLRIIDMGAGKGYLTFALYDHLTTLGHKAEITGIEFRPDLVTLCNRIAQENTFSGLTFQQGAIESANCASAHIVIALHACDTATDDALHQAVKAGAELIIVAPCCHKQIRQQLNSSITAKSPSHPLHLLLKHGTYQERLAEMLTDGIRAHLLEIQGYKTNLFEFINGEHTPKNVMITALKRPTPPSPENKAKLQLSLQHIKSHFGLHAHHLETLLS